MAERVVGEDRVKGTLDLQLCTIKLTCFIHCVVVLASRPTETVRCEAPPLTFERLFEVVKGLRSKWRDLSFLLGLSGKLEEIQRQHGSGEEACLKAVIEAFLRGGGHHQPSWRRVIRTLYLVREAHIAQDIISYAEPVEGEGVCELLRA